VRRGLCFGRRFWNARTDPRILRMTVHAAAVQTVSLASHAPNSRHETLEIHSEIKRPCFALRDTHQRAKLQHGAGLHRCSPARSREGHDRRSGTAERCLCAPSPHSSPPRGEEARPPSHPRPPLCSAGVKGFFAAREWRASGLPLLSPSPFRGEGRGEGAAGTPCECHSCGNSGRRSGASHPWRQSNAWNLGKDPRVGWTALWPERNLPCERERKFPWAGRDRRMCGGVRFRPA